MGTNLSSLESRWIQSIPDLTVQVLGKQRYKLTPKVHMLKEIVNLIILGSLGLFRTKINNNYCFNKKWLLINNNKIHFNSKKLNKVENNWTSTI